VPDIPRQKNTIARQSRKKPLVPINAKKRSGSPDPVVGKELNVRERAFCSEYFSNGFNGMRAAIAAGYSERSAAAIASELLTRPKVVEVLDQMTSNRLKRLAIDADWILKETVELYERAKKSDAYGPAANLLKMMGQEAGVFQEKKEVNHTVKIENLLESAAKDVTDADYEVINNPPAQ
jgi:phage terminase small subunit